MTLLDGLIDRVKSLASRKTPPSMNESQTRRVFVDPLLRCAGWDVDGIDEVQSEYPVLDKRVDYGILNSGRPILLVEAKKFGSNLNDVAAIAQSVNYGNTLNVPFSVLTDGRSIGVYKVHAPVAMPDKLFRFADLVTSSREVIDETLGLISKPSVLTGETSRRWELEWGRRKRLDDFHVRHDGIVDENLRRVVIGVEEQLGITLQNEGVMNTFRANDGRLFRFYMSSPYQGSQDTWFLKIDPRHFECDIFVLSSADASVRWIVPTEPLKAFLKGIPLSARKRGAKTWDPRFRFRDGKSVLWTNEDEYGSFPLPSPRMDKRDAVAGCF